MWPRFVGGTGKAGWWMFDDFWRTSPCDMILPSLHTFEDWFRSRISKLFVCPCILNGSCNLYIITHICIYIYILSFWVWVARVAAWHWSVSVSEGSMERVGVPFTIGMTVPGMDVGWCWLEAETSAATQCMMIIWYVMLFLQVVQIFRIIHMWGNCIGEGLNNCLNHCDWLKQIWKQEVELTCHQSSSKALNLHRPKIVRHDVSSFKIVHERWGIWNMAPVTQIKHF